MISTSTTTTSLTNMATAKKTRKFGAVGNPPDNTIPSILTYPGETHHRPERCQVKKEPGKGRRGC